jgi:hypothetical protein
MQRSSLENLTAINALESVEVTNVAILGLTELGIMLDEIVFNHFVNEVQTQRKTEQP